MMNFNFYNFKSSFLSALLFVMNYPNDLVLQSGFFGIIPKNIAINKINACSLVIMEIVLSVRTNVRMDELTVSAFEIIRLIIFGTTDFQNKLSSIFFNISTFSNFSYFKLSSMNW